MKKVLIVFFVLGMNVLCSAQWNKVKSTSISFKIKNAGISVDGNFKTATIKVNVDEANPAKSSFSGVVEAKSINTDNNLRDSHLRDKEEFFNVSKYPSLSMKSVSVTKKSAGVYTVVWDMTIKGVTRRFSSDVLTKAEGDLLLISTEFKVNRRDWNVGENSMIMSDNVSIKLKSTLSK